ncbi:hypothetical protein A2U01_0013260 [Trifolium medium]|uniref:Uncharacterized protein n=1 Tax=Trifolium medium TaxID=97028 RepID=A0A392MYC6_9FABA|nr:hypothetical protein [Trifolium medium]
MHYALCIMRSTFLVLLRSAVDAFCTFGVAAFCIFGFVVFFIFGDATFCVVVLWFFHQHWREYNFLQMGTPFERVQVRTGYWYSWDT